MHSVIGVHSNSQLVELPLGVPLSCVSGDKLLYIHYTLLTKHNSSSLVILVCYIVVKNRSRCLVCINCVLRYVVYNTLHIFKVQEHKTDRES